MAVGKVLAYSEVSETDKYKPHDRVRFSFIGQVDTYTNREDNYIKQSEGEVIQRHQWDKETYYQVDDGDFRVMIKEEAIHELI